MNLESVMEGFERFLEEEAPLFEGFHPHYNEYLWEMVRNGGKRFRPRLLLGVVSALAPLLVKSAYAPALALEILHTYSLIHDDLPAMDNAATRRGHPTLHVKYDEASAILAGDALNTHAFYLLAQAPLGSDTKVALVRELASAGGAGGMVLGQALDCYFEHQKLEIEKLRFIHLHKTGRLIAASLKMGAIIAALSKEEQARLEEIGLKLGLLFQVQDDIIDATWSEEEAGKTTQNDGAKNSYVNLLGLEGARMEHARLKEEVRVLLGFFPEALSLTLLEILEKQFKS
ncbi:polyprenyl synthetase family protein [Wolinella succinogenes]|uniref:polyprenyl synthetase family protein n=1 Tax=Wolinella succinogenes TaxID=844 RepID=UPI00240A6821|nr:polyprenyl synthetase family protein [Wolinella succinogenes]